MKRDKKRKLELEEPTAEVESILSITKSYTVSNNDTQATTKAAAKVDKAFSVQSIIESVNVNKNVRHDAPVEEASQSNNGTAAPELHPLHKKKERVVKPSSLWNFIVDYNDHFETPPIAYKDISPVLAPLVPNRNKSVHCLVLPAIPAFSTLVAFSTSSMLFSICKVCGSSV